MSTGAGNDKWYVYENGDRCAKHCRDSASDDAACGVPAYPPRAYYNTVERCCKRQLDYLNTGACAELSEGGGDITQLRGTGEYYIEWVEQKCIKNCPVGTGAGCGGVATGVWVPMHPDATECCNELYFVDQEECVRDATTA